MQEPPKRRRTSRGECALCGAEFGKAQMTRHLEKHQEEQKVAPGLRASRFHLIVEGRHAPGRLPARPLAGVLWPPQRVHD